MYEDVLYCALGINTVKAIGVLNTSYYVHACGDRSVVPTTKSGQVDPIFACAMLFTLCVEGRLGGPQETVKKEAV